MKKYSPKRLRNVGIIGHSGSGKTTLTEAILYYTKATDRFGKIEDGNTVSDYDTEEKKRKISLSTSLAFCEYNDVKINLVDMPGYFDFIGETMEGLRAVDTAMIVVSGVSGIQVGTEKSWDYVNRGKLPRAFYVNKLDRENADFVKTLNELKQKFGMTVVPVQYPIGNESSFRGIVNVISGKTRIFDKKTKSMKEIDIPEDMLEKVNECKNMIMEAVAETSEELLDKYFDKGTLSDEDIYTGLIDGCAKGEVVPVMCGSALTGIGIQTLIEDIIECFPSCENLNPVNASDMEGNSELTVKIDEKESFSAFVFKTIADPFVGKLSLFRVMTGKLTPDMTVYNVKKAKNEKVGAMYFLRGKQQIPASEITAGDLGAVSKLQFTNTGDTLSYPQSPIVFEDIKFPQPVISMAVLPKSKNDEDKILNGLNKMAEEDLTFKVSRDTENAEAIISGLGETHIDVISCRLKSKFGLEVILQQPKVPYRETIKKTSDVQGKHKKQSGGHGQYGDVKIKFEPRIDGEDDLEFVDKVVGGVVPRQYIPAVEKGLRECINHGVLAGYPVIRLKATLHDGSYHPVDSSEMAFKVAASLAYKKGLMEAEPILLEPIEYVEISVPEYYMGDIIGDINKKRGRVLGTENSGGNQIIIAEIPQAEMFKYATDLRSMTQARGSFTMKFEKYEEVPNSEVNKIMENKNKVKIKS
ncbi:elongation factor G [Clostridium luticellarii]|jgi:elongation factor G|uniref:Elongation factor G n=1 Tax=Clostridium luticellarii TaxID=1691940 RepID=A0A2T0BS15_9CLOT|nr:elongation factor G [Clostridium luticellarii]MCI1944655.1 elongation factor G [Clostridium luticellarii]PRR86681.1 Elongation factor G [Clostridium luticellarii]